MNPLCWILPLISLVLSTLSSKLDAHFQAEGKLRKIMLALAAVFLAIDAVLLIFKYFV